jgi:hypothetical protein
MDERVHDRCVKLSRYRNRHRVTLLGESENWTLLDQHGVARTPQDGQLIGTVASIIAPGIIVFDNAETKATEAMPVRVTWLGLS